MLMKRLLLSMALLAMTGFYAFADGLPDFVSTGGKWKWFYLKNVAYEKYITANAPEVEGEDKADPADFKKVAKQLWCFTTEDSVWYTITNKYEGLQLSVGLSPAHNNWESTQVYETSNTKFKLRFMGDGQDTVALQSMNKAPGGGDIFVWPAMYGSEPDKYMFWLVRESNSEGTSSYFALEPYEGPEDPVAQDDKEVPYYNIQSAREGGDGEVIIDNTSVVDTKYKFTIGSAETAGEASQWRLVNNAPGKTAIVNRATGNSISTDIYADGRYNLPEAADKATVPATWNINAVADGEFAISAINPDGIRRYLNNTAVDAAPDSLDFTKMADGTFAWKFVKTGSVVGINDATSAAASTVSVVGGKVVVSGGKKFSVFTTDGVRLPADAVLSRGIYIVSVDGKSVKINVR